MLIYIFPIIIIHLFYIFKRCNFFIFSLEQLPERGAVRRIGAYISGNYHQLFVKNYCIIYRVLKEKKEVHIVTVRYTPSNF